MRIIMRVPIIFSFYFRHWSQCSGVTRFLFWLVVMLSNIGLFICRLIRWLFLCLFPVGFFWQRFFGYIGSFIFTLYWPVVLLKLIAVPVGAVADVRGALTSPCDYWLTRAEFIFLPDLWGTPLPFICTISFWLTSMLASILAMMNTFIHGYFSIEVVLDELLEQLIVCTLFYYWFVHDCTEKCEYGVYCLLCIFTRLDAIGVEFCIPFLPTVIELSYDLSVFLPVVSFFFSFFWYLAFVLLFTYYSDFPIIHWYYTTYVKMLQKFPRFYYLRTFVRESFRICRYCICTGIRLCYRISIRIVRGGIVPFFLFYWDIVAQCMSLVFATCLLLVRKGRVFFLFLLTKRNNQVLFFIVLLLLFIRVVFVCLFFFM